MTKATRLELFAALVAQLPLLTRDDLDDTVEAMRQSPGFARMLEHARLQAEEMNLAEDLFEPIADSAPGVVDDDMETRPVTGVRVAPHRIAS